MPVTQNIKAALQAQGAAPVYACRAWVNFNGTGTVAIRASGNVSSITDNGIGDYTVNLTTPLADGNYGTVLGAGNTANNLAFGFGATITKATGSFRFILAASNTNAFDCSDINLAFFR